MTTHRSWPPQALADRSRVALTRAQIDAYDLPPQPPKRTDSRARARLAPRRLLGAGRASPRRLRSRQPYILDPHAAVVADQRLGYWALLKPYR